MTWTVGPDEHAWFTAFSGDANPIHDDPAASRRLLGGRMLVHGAHLLLRALDDAARAGAILTTPERIHVLFRHGVAPGDPIESDLRSGATGVVVTSTGAADGRELAVVTITPAGAPVAAFTPPDQPAERPGAPRPLDVETLATMIGADQPTFRPAVDRAACAARFPAATAALGAGRVAELAAISFVIGMMTPGRSSMSSSYDIGWEPCADDPVVIGHTVAGVDPRWRRVVLQVAGTSLRATVTAFSPPPPVDQTTVLAGGARPRPGEFASWRALVVGGDRGLGEATARLLVAGGADVRVTWAECAGDARRVAADLGVPVSRWRAPDDDPADLIGDGWQPTHLLWFASPPTDHDPAAQVIEIDAFERAIRALGASLTAALWPSTDRLDAAPTDRTASGFLGRKAAGEAVCAATGAHAARLPALLTDRTQSLLPREYGDTARELLRALRATAGTRLRAAPGGPDGGSDTVARHE